MTEQYIEELIQKYADGSASEDEVRQLMNWYRSMPGEDIEWVSGNPAEKKEVHDRILHRLRNDSTWKPRPVLPLHWIKIAAILIVALGIAFLWRHLAQPASPSFLTISNPSGKLARVVLPDSSEVWLNASSTLRYAEKFKQHRELKLEGEAFFDVTHDPEHPFTVEAGEIKTTVLGTSFVVNAYTGNPVSNISVISGKVKVDRDNKQLGIVTPSRQLQFNNQQKTVSISSIDTNTVLAWKNGTLLFQGESFENIARALENWYGITIEFANPGMRSCRYYLSFENTMPLDKLLTVLSAATETEYRFDRSTRTVRLSGNDCK